MTKLMRAMYLALLFKRMITRFRSRKQSALIVYASVTGNAAKYASDLGTVLTKGCNVSYFDACAANLVQDSLIVSSITAAKLIIFVSSTQGNGEIPPLSQKFFSALWKHGHLLEGKKVAVLGFGSSAYPIFCGAGIYLASKMVEHKAIQVTPLGKCDSVKGEASMFYEWMRKLVEVEPLMAKLYEDIKDKTVSYSIKHLADSVTVQVFPAEEVKSAAAQSVSYMDMSMHSHASFASSNEGVDQKHDLVTKVVSCLMSGSSCKTDVLVGDVIDRADLISIAAPSKGEDVVTRKTSLVKINLVSCGNPPYKPGSVS